MGNCGTNCAPRACYNKPGHNMSSKNNSSTRKFLPPLVVLISEPGSSKQEINFNDGSLYRGKLHPVTNFREGFGV